MASPSPEFRAKLESLTPEKLNNLYKYLCYFIMKHYGGIQGLDPLNIVSEIIQDALAGKISYPSDKTLRQFLRDVSYRRAYYIAKKSKKHPLFYTDDVPPESMSVQESANQHVYCQEVLNAMRRFARNRPDLLDLIDVIEDEPGVKRSEKALRLRVPVKKVDCLKKRLDRRVSEIRNGQKKWERPKK
jgi:hypothetical protein